MDMGHCGVGGEMSIANEPASPVVGDLMLVQNIGLTKRELFAAMAMESLAADYCDKMYPDQLLAARAVAVADALIAALEAK